MRLPIFAALALALSGCVASYPAPPSASTALPSPAAQSAQAAAETFLTVVARVEPVAESYWRLKITNILLKESVHTRLIEQKQFRREIWLESHYLWGDFCIRIGEPGVWAGHGPFVAASVLSDGGFLNSVGLGYMVALKRDPENPDDNSYTTRPDHPR